MRRENRKILVPASRQVLVISLQGGVVRNVLPATNVTLSRPFTFLEIFTTLNQVAQPSVDDNNGEYRGRAHESRNKDGNDARSRSFDEGNYYHYCNTPKLNDAVLHHPSPTNLFRKSWKSLLPLCTVTGPVPRRRLQDRPSASNGGYRRRQARLPNRAKPVQRTDRTKQTKHRLADRRAHTGPSRLTAEHVAESQAGRGGELHGDPIRQGGDSNRTPPPRAFRDVLKLAAETTTVEATEGVTAPFPVIKTTTVRGQG